MTTTQSPPVAHRCLTRRSVAKTDRATEIKPGPAPLKKIDLHLSILAAEREPGVTFSQGEIARFCGCSPQNIARLEKSAMERLKRHPAAALLKEFLTA